MPGEALTLVPEEDEEEEEEEEEEEAVEEEMETAFVPFTAPTQTSHIGVDFGVHVPAFMMPFIANASDVLGDGNCGYRVLAHVIGWGQEDWRRMRWEIVLELRTHYETYAAVYPYMTPIDELIRNVSTDYHWMETPMVGLAFTTRFQCALVILSERGPHTCLPMIASEAPPSPVWCLVTTIAHLGNHYVLVSHIC